jgi:hypothetical protein
MVVPHLVNASTAEFKRRWMRLKEATDSWTGPGTLEKFYDKLKDMAGVMPVDELFESMMFYLMKFTMHSQETVKEYVAREATVWEQLQDALDAMTSTVKDDGGDPWHGIRKTEPLHDQLRGMLLLRRSNINSRDYPMILKELGLKNQLSYASVSKAICESYQEIHSLKGNQGTFIKKNERPKARVRPSYQRGYVAEADEEEDDYNSDHDDDIDYDDEVDEFAGDEEEEEWSYAATEHPEFAPVSKQGELDARGQWWTSSQKSLEQQDAILAADDEEYNNALISFTEAKAALRNARVAREFYPVVVPASVFVKKGSGKGFRKGKGKSRGKGKRRGKSKGKGKKGQKGKKGPGKTGKTGKGRSSAKARGDAARGASSSHASQPADKDGQPYKKRIITCYKCGQAGHISTECPNAPKKRAREDPAHLAESWDDYDEEDDYHIDAEEWDEESYDDEDHSAYLVVDPESALVAVEKDSLYRGCLVIDTGCSCSVSSLRAADFLQLDRIAEEGAFWSETVPSNKKFGFANGLSHQCAYQVTQEFAHGILAGESLTLQILDQPGNSTAPLLSINDLAELGAVLDLANHTISIRGRPPVKLPRSKTGLTIIPVTKSAVERWQEVTEQPVMSASVDVLAVEEESGQPDEEEVAGLCSLRQALTNPARLPLSRQQQQNLHLSLKRLKADTQQALLSVKESKSKMRIVSYPILWKDRDDVKQLSYSAGCALDHTGAPALRRTIDALKPGKFIAYCPWSRKSTYHMIIQACMIQATVHRKFYLWSSFHPRHLYEDPIVDHMLTYFKLYTRRYFHDMATPQVSELYLFTNDPTYGALMEAHHDGGPSIPWAKQVPSAEDLSGLWSRSYQIWTSRDQEDTGRLIDRLEERACFADEDALVTRAEEQGLNPGSSSDGLPPGLPPKPPVAQSETPSVDWGHTDVDRWLTKIHVNVGHVPPKQMAHCLKEAGYAPEFVNRARHLHCELCQKSLHTVPSRPTKMMRSRILGKVVALDFSFHTIYGTQYLILHFVCEASRFHYAHIVAKSADGNCSSQQLCQLLSKWTAFMGYPSRLHVDSEGCFKGDEFLQYCSDHSIQISMCAGQAHWQNGIVERHIGVFKSTLDKLLLEKGESPQEHDGGELEVLQVLVNETTQIKNDFGRYGGSSPSQWMTGRRHPVLDNDEPPPTGDQDLEALEEHLSRRNHVAGLFHAADARATIKLAERARHRVVSQPQPGMLVYYFRRSKGTKYQPIHAGYRGPARVLALEPSTVRQGTSVIWLSHGGNLIRCAPEHLRFATELERTVYDSKNASLNITQDLRRGLMRQFEDLGEPPSQSERQEAEGMDAPFVPVHAPFVPAHAPFVPAQVSMPNTVGPPRSYGPNPVSSHDEKTSEKIKKKEASAVRTEPAQPQRRPSPSTRSSADSPSLTPKVKKARKVRSSASVEVRPNQDKAFDHMMDPFDPGSPEVEPPNQTEVFKKMMVPFNESEDVDMPDVPDRTNSDERDHPVDPADVPIPEDNSLCCPSITEHNVLAAYSDHLHLDGVRHRGYTPCFTVTEHSKVKKAQQRQWKDTCVEISMDWYDSDNQALSATEDFTDHFAYMLSDGRRKNEVNIHSLTADEKREMNSAKKIEADQWIGNAVYTVAKRAGIPKNRIMSMRWILTWKKIEETGGRKAKARLVVKGFTDPDLLQIRAESPTLSKIGRNCLLQLAASYKMTLSMGDVKTAFLQGNQGESERDIYGDIPADSRDLFNLAPDEVIKLEGSVYGLRTAPKAWFAKVTTDLLSLGAVQHPLDQCVFIFFDKQGKLMGAIGVYVDDFLFAETDGSEWKSMMKKIKDKYTWGKHDYQNFILCGVQYRQDSDYSITMDQRDYVESLSPHDLRPDHELKCLKDNEEITNKKWLKRFRGANGALQWLSTNTRPDLAADTSISAGTSGVGVTKNSILNAQKIYRKAHARIGVEVRIKHIRPEDLRFSAFHDAGWASRPDNSSQGGLMIFACHKDLLDGKEATISLIEWKSWKLKRVCRSSLSAECQAMAEALDTLNFVRFFWEILTGKSKITPKIDQDHELTKAPMSSLITDCKGLFDAVNRSQSAGLGLSEKRTAIEALSIRQICTASNVSVKWVNSDRQLADILTKVGVMPENLDRALNTNQWRIVFDSTFTSAKNLRKQKREMYFKKTVDPTSRSLLAELTPDEMAHVIDLVRRHGKRE